MLKSYLIICLTLAIASCSSSSDKDSEQASPQNSGTTVNKSNTDIDGSGQHIEQLGLPVTKWDNVNYEISIPDEMLIAYKAPKFKASFTNIRTRLSSVGIDDYYKLNVSETGKLEGYNIKTKVPNNTEQPFYVDTLQKRTVYDAPPIRYPNPRPSVSQRMSLITVMRADGNLYATQVSKQCYDAEQKKIFTNMDQFITECSAKNMTQLDLVDHATLGNFEPEVYLSGRIEIQNGRIVKIGNNSGNYPNTNDSFKTLVFELAKQGYLDGMQDFNTTYRFNPNGINSLEGSDGTKHQMTQFLQEDKTLPVSTVSIDVIQNKVLVRYNCENNHYPIPSGIHPRAEVEPIIQGINFKALSLDKNGIMTYHSEHANTDDFLISAYCPGYHHKADVLSAP